MPKVIKSVLEEANYYLKNKTNKWIVSSGQNALDAMEDTINGCKHVFVFGAPFTHGGKGLHDIHMNQGDPKGSEHYHANGIWQDGGTIVQKPSGKLVAFLTRFTTQSTDTDDEGNPV